MIVIRNFILFIFFLFLLINFLLDFSVINDQFSKNGKEFISKYLVVHKHTNNLEKEIKELTKERNKFERLKIMIEEVYTDLKDDTVEMGYKADMLDTVFKQIDPYEFDLNIKKLNSNLEFTFNSEHSFSNDDVTEFLKDKLAKFKIPVHFWWINKSLPRGATDKLDRILTKKLCLDSEWEKFNGSQ